MAVIVTVKGASTRVPKAGDVFISTLGHSYLFIQDGWVNGNAIDLSNPGVPVNCTAPDRYVYKGRLTEVITSLE